MTLGLIEVSEEEYQHLIDAIYEYATLCELTQKQADRYAFRIGKLIGEKTYTIEDLTKAIREHIVQETLPAQK